MADRQTDDFKMCIRDSDEGHLLCTYTGNEAPDYYINDAGHLCLNI